MQATSALLILALKMPFAAVHEQGVYGCVGRWECIGAGHWNIIHFVSVHTHEQAHKSVRSAAHSSVLKGLTRSKVWNSRKCTVPSASVDVSLNKEPLTSTE